MVGGINTIDITKDDSKLLIPLDNKTYIFSMTNYSQIKVFGNHNIMVHSAKYNSDDTKIVTAGIDKKLKVWDVTNNYSELTSID